MSKIIRERNRFELDLILESNGYVRTYADNHYGRIRGPNQADRIEPGIIFLIVFGCLVGGFLIFCILGTLVIEMFDHGFSCIRRYFR